MLLLVLAGPTSVEAAEPVRVSVGLQAGRVSVTAHGAELARVLAELSRQGGFPINLDAALEARVALETTTVALRDLTPEHALRRLLGPASLVFVYASDGLAEVLAYDDPTNAVRDVAATPRAGRTKARPVVEGTGPAMPKPRPLVEAGVPIDKPVPEFEGSTGEKPAPVSRSDEPLPDAEQARPDPGLLEAQALTAADAAVRWRAMEGLGQSDDAALASSTASRVLARNATPTCSSGPSRSCPTRMPSRSNRCSGSPRARARRACAFAPCGCLSSEGTAARASGSC